VHRDLTPAVREMAATLHRKVVDKHVALVHLRLELAETRRQIFVLRRGERGWPTVAKVLAATVVGAALPHLVWLAFG
jgi:hypothetical protein